MTGLEVRARRAVRSVRAEVQSARRVAAHRAWMLTAAGAANQKELKELRGRYSGRRCIVMGNGPSLLQSRLDILAREVTVVSNANFLIWDRLTYVPTFLTVEDNLVAEDRAAELRALDGPTKIFPLDLKGFLGPPSGQRTIYLNFVREYRGFPRFSFDLARRCYWGGTVSYLNLQLAAYLGCTTIVLIGFDHNYSVPTDEVKDTVIRSRTPDVNHIHPNYFGPGYRWHDPNVARMEVAYAHARQMLERVGVRIVNATVGGQLEVFERVALEDVLSVQA